VWIQNQKCREFTDSVPDGFKAKSFLTFLLIKDTLSDARFVEDNSRLKETSKDVSASNIQIFGLQSNAPK
jgi:hypothetical protein